MITALSERKVGVLLGYISITIRNVVGLLLIPFIIHHVGISEYGIYSLVTTLSGYLIILEMGLSNTTIRFLSKYKANNNKEQEKQFLSVIFFIYGAITLFVLCVGALIWLNIPNLFEQSLSSNEISILQPAFLVLLISIAITLMSNSFTGIISAYERFKFQKSIEIFIFILRCLLIIISLELGFGVFYIVVIDTIINFISAVIKVIFVKFKLDVHIILKFPDKQTIKEISLYTFFIAVNVVVNQINWRVDNLIIGMLTSAASVGIFSIGNQLVFSFIALASAVSNVFTPKIVKMVTLNATTDELTNEIIKIGRLQMMVLGFVLVVFIAHGSLFIDLFVGKTFSEAYWVALFPMIPFIFVLAQTSTNSVLQAMNKHKARSLLLLLTALLNVILSIFLVDRIGMVGASIGTALTLFFGELVLVNIYLIRVIKLNMFKYYRVILASSLPVISISMFFSFWISSVIEASWFGLIAACTFTAVMYFIFTYVFILTTDEKKLFKISLPNIKF